VRPQRHRHLAKATSSKSRARHGPLVQPNRSGCHRASAPDAGGIRLAERGPRPRRLAVSQGGHWVWRTPAERTLARSAGLTFRSLTKLIEVQLIEGPVEGLGFRLLSWGWIWATWKPVGHAGWEAAGMGWLHPASAAWRRQWPMGRRCGGCPGGRGAEGSVAVVQGSGIPFPLGCTGLARRAEQRSNGREHRPRPGPSRQGQAGVVRLAMQGKPPAMA